MSRLGWTLSSAHRPLALLGVGERTVPSLGTGQRPGPVAVLARDARIPAAERRAAQSPFRGARVGQLRWGGELVKQTSPVTCGALSLLLLAAAGDPVLALWLMTGKRSGSVTPPELRGLRPHELGLATVAERLAAAERAVHARSRRHALGPLDWPRALGTPPWTAAREARFRGVTYTHVVVHDRDVARTRTVLQAVKAANRAGIPVPLYSGGDLARGGSLATALPRHVVLALPSHTAARNDDELRVFDPSAGRVHRVLLPSLLARTRPHAALGGWSHVTWAVLPKAAGA